MSDSKFIEKETPTSKGDKLIAFNSEKEVTDYCKKNGNLQWAIFEGQVYDLTEYLPLHPGGQGLIEPYLGMSIDDPFEENDHTQSARNLFNDLPKKGFVKGANSNNSDSDTQASEKSGSKEKVQEIQGLDGYVLKGQWKPDYNKGILMQIWTSKLSFDEYVQFIEEPKHLINPVRDIRIFNSSFLEFFTRTPWYVIPIFWAPITVYYLNLSELDPFSFFFYTIAGIVNWTYLEYILHRFLFHGEDYWLPPNNTAYAAHFLIHGIHHAFPQDRYRLVFPIIGGIAVKECFVEPLYGYFLPAEIMPAIIAGTIIGYVGYDMIHYFTHHSSPKDGYWKDLKIYHMQHHYKNGKAGYGVSNKFWDIVFNTELKY